MYLPTCTIYQRLSFNPRPHLKVVYCFITEIASDSGSALQIMITLQEIYVCKCNNLRRNEEADNTSLLYKSNTNYYYYYFFFKATSTCTFSLCFIYLSSSNKKYIFYTRLQWCIVCYRHYGVENTCQWIFPAGLTSIMRRPQLHVLPGRWT